MPTKILHICQSAGGVETHILYLIKYLDMNEYQNSLVCWTNGSLGERAKALGVDVHLVELVREISAIKDLRALVAIYRFIKQNHFDIIHTHSGKGGIIGRLAARLAGHKAVVYTPNAFLYLRFKGIKRKFFLFLERISRHWTDHLIATSTSEAFRGIHDVRFRSDKVSVIYNSIDIKAFAISADNRAKNSQPTVLFVGRLDYQKNPEMFIRVSNIIHKKISNIKYRMLGFGRWDSLGNSVRNMIKEYGLADRYTLISWLPKEKATEVISESSLLVLTSRYEGLPYVALEAMALCKPVVATDVDGPKDIVLHGETGFLVDLDDDERMANYILQLLEDKRVRKKMGETARERVKALFNIEKNIKQVEIVYDSLMNACKDYLPE